MLEVALKFFGPVLVVMVFFSILSLLRRNEKRTSSASASIVLEFGWVLKCVPWLSLFSSVGFPMAMYVQEINDIQEYGIGSYIFVIGLSSSLSVYTYLESYFVKFTVSGSTIYCESPWRKNRHVDVSDIVQVKFSQALKYYVLKTKNDGIIRIYMYMNGVPSFLDFLEKQLGIKIERYY